MQIHNFTLMMKAYVGITNEENLKVVGSIYYDNQPLPPNITEGDIFSLLNGDMLNGNIIHAFPTSLVTTKQNLKLEIVLPILYGILRNMGGRRKEKCFYEISSN